jgi:hypothetical protein
MSVFYHNIASTTDAVLSDIAQFGLLAFTLGIIILLPSFWEKKE